MGGDGEESMSNLSPLPAHSKFSFDEVDATFIAAGDPIGADNTAFPTLTHHTTRPAPRLTARHLATHPRPPLPHFWSFVNVIARIHLRHFQQHELTLRRAEERLADPRRQHPLLAPRKNEPNRLVVKPAPAKKYKIMRVR